MCTVTYLPLGNNDFILTSNRDEDPKRRTIPPKEYNEDGVKLRYPKDELAGGTWIGLSEKNRLICLLNGGFTKHVRETFYKMSRGVIVKELLKVNNPIEIIRDFDFEGIEPFTIVLVDWKETLLAYELVWDGVEKSFKILNNSPYIWSSSTLYTKEMKEIRKTWFKDWLKNKNEYFSEDIINFHTDETKGDSEISLKMKRINVQTVSVTSVSKKGENVNMDYYDLLQEERTAKV